MYIIKKMLIMGSINDNEGNGVLKFENFGERTSCNVNILGAEKDSYLAIACNNEIVTCRQLNNGKFFMDENLDLNNFIQAIVLTDGEVVCVGSTKGKACSYGALASSARSKIKEIKGEKLTTYEQKGFFGKLEDTQQIVENNSSATKRTEQNSDSQRSKKSETKTQSVAMQKSSPLVRKTSQNVANEVDEVDKNIGQNATQKIKQNLEQNAGKTSPVGEHFFDTIKEQLGELMSKYAHDEELEAVIDNSEWVKIPIDNSSYYVAGLVKDNGKPSVLCYGVPDKNKENPPSCKEECRQWLELEKDGRGYWMMYQSAKDGTTLTSM